MILEEQQYIQSQELRVLKDIKLMIKALLPTEHQIQATILDRLGFLKDSFFWRQNSGMAKSEYKGKTRFWRSGIAGIADIMGVYKGKAIAIEVKRPKKKQSDDQIAFQQRFEECGGIYVVCSDATAIVKQIDEKM